MDPLKIPQGSEGCSSNESGWTAYLASPHQEGSSDDDDSEDHGTDEEESEELDGEDAQSDDSMASDASSGPGDQHRHGLDHARKKDKGEIANKRCKRPVDKKQHREEIKSSKDKSGCKGKTAEQSTKW